MLDPRRPQTDSRPCVPLFPEKHLGHTCASKCTLNNLIKIQWATASGGSPCCGDHWLTDAASLPGKCGGSQESSLRSWFWTLGCVPGSSCRGQRREGEGREDGGRENRGKAGVNVLRMLRTWAMLGPLRSFSEPFNAVPHFQLQV